jgi:hypothetical protein
VVEVVNVNVMVAVCPEVRLDLLVSQLRGMVVVTVFTVISNVSDVNIVDPFLLDMDI